MGLSKIALIEFFLFASPKPLKLLQLKEMIGDMEIEEIREAIVWLQEHVYTSDRALQICEVAEGYQLCTRPEFHPWLQNLSDHQTKTRLSHAALEVLAIVTYKQPVTRNEVEGIRGVNCGFLLRNLLKYKLIQIAGKKDCPGRPVLYETGKEFLSYFGLKDLKELPKEEELKGLIESDGNDERHDQSQ